MATQSMRAIGPTQNETMKPLPSLPTPGSPTLTNPDMVLPDEPSHSSPQRGWNERPPSPSYLLDNSQGSPQHDAIDGSAMTIPKKEKRGLMSRKMMLLRSRTASSGVRQVTDNEQIPRSVAVGAPQEEYTVDYGSVPASMDAGNPAPQQSVQKRGSSGGSSLGSDDMNALPQFLARYEDEEEPKTDDEPDGDKPAMQSHGYIESGLEAQRRQQEEDEHTSAILSQRAETILANAKKRLNLMEGNLRGARDLVTPLTAANLKRATSVGSSFASAGSTGVRARYIQDGYQYNSSKQEPTRRLHAQASSPIMGKDYRTGHWRGNSETRILDRSYSSLDRAASPVIGNGRIPVKASNPSWSNTLKGSRSHDSLGAPVALRTVGRDPMHSRGSPSPNLGPLEEDETLVYPSSERSSRTSGRRDALGIDRSESRAEDLREQMSSLKGRISSLKERAKEDSLRRQSMQNLREPSPLNNATVYAPELFYSQSQAFGSPAIDTNAGVGQTSQSDNPTTPQSAQRAREPNEALTANQDDFSGQGPKMQQQQAGHEVSRNYSRPKTANREESSAPLHQRASSGTSNLQPSKQSHSHQFYHARNGPEEHATGEFADSSNGKDSYDTGVATDSSSWHSNTGETLETEDTIYEDVEPEDAEAEEQSTFVAHEDREDAFDYENFFLHSALAANRRGSASSSSDETVSSAETARGPAAPGAEVEEGDDEMDDADEESPQSSPGTPKGPSGMEWELSRSKFSDDSVTTLASFATATEGRDTPAETPALLHWPMNSSENIERPSTALLVERPGPIALSDSSSDRADSGVGLPRRPNSSQSSKRPALRSQVAHKAPLSPNSGSSSKLLSPPMSPQALADPATVAVNALLAPKGGQLGLRDKSVLFGLIEGLTKVCHKLQDGTETDLESKMLRQRLDDARKVLNGIPLQQPESS